MNDTTMITCASYERVSTRIQGKYGFSLSAQHVTLEEYARQQGWTLPGHLRFRDGEDEDASGARWDLPGLTAMLDAAGRKEFSVLVVPDLDRFARTLVKGLVLEEQLKKHGVRVVYQRVPVEDTPEGQLLKHQLFSFAEYERQKFRLRTSLGRQQKARIGQVVGTGPCAPYGYRFTYQMKNNQRKRCGLEPDPVTAPVARDSLLALRAESTTAVAERLNERGTPSPTPGKPWNATMLYRMAMNTVYAGEWTYSGIGVSVDPLITADEQAAILAAMRRRRVARRGRVPKDEDPYLLRGMLTCGHCHGAIQTVKQPVKLGGTRYYRCGCHTPSFAKKQHRPVCDLPHLRAVDVEEELWRILNATLLNEAYLAKGLDAAQARHADDDRLRQERLAAIDAEIAKHRNRLNALVDELVDLGPESRDAVRRRMQESNNLIERLTTERAELAAVRAEGLSPAEAASLAAFAKDIRLGLTEATPAERRQLFELLRIRGTVYLDPEGVQLSLNHRYRIEWTGAIQLLNSDTHLLKTVMRIQRR